VQLRRRLGEVEKEMTKLLEKATKKAVEMRGEAVKGRINPSGESKKKGKLILGY